MVGNIEERADEQRMQADLNSDVALSAANALVAHLRRDPHAATRPARELASEFGLDESFVAQVLHGIHEHRRPEPRQALPRRGSRHSFATAVKRGWLRATARPIVFVAVTFVLSFIGVFASGFIAHLLPSHKLGIGISIAGLFEIVFVLGIIGATFLAHMGTYFRHRVARNALYGGLMLYAALLLFIGWMSLRGDLKSTGSAPSPFVLFLLGATGMLFISLMYAGVGSLAAVLGGWTRFKLQEREEETMSRQDLLERYFELQSRLRTSAYPRPGLQASPIFSSKGVAWYRRAQLPVNVALGFAISLLAMVSLRASGVNPGEPNPEINAWFFVLMLINISQFIVYILQGYVSRSAWQATLGALFFTGGRLIVRFLPIYEAASRMSIRDSLWVEIFDAGLMVLMSLAGYLGAVVQNRAVKELNLQRNDQATLLAEMVRIQWKLSNEAAAVCVMVVDAAKSSEMKADADPLAVEYTFREYQEWMERISAERGGRIHSTAGDGVVVAFTTCALALSAARNIQSELFQFNKDVNRLKHPFRLRIGLHTGEVVGDINQVQFTEVIDIAAHIEAMSPVGGIAVSGEVAARLPEEEFIDLNASVDGQQVFMVTKPTEFA